MRYTKNQYFRALAWMDENNKYILGEVYAVSRGNLESVFGVDSYLQTHYKVKKPK